MLLVSFSPDICLGLAEDRLFNFISEALPVRCVIGMALTCATVSMSMLLRLDMLLRNYASLRIAVSFIFLGFLFSISLDREKKKKKGLKKF